MIGVYIDWTTDLAEMKRKDVRSWHFLVSPDGLKHLLTSDSRSVMNLTGYWTYIVLSLSAAVS